MMDKRLMQLLVRTETRKAELFVYGDIESSDALWYNEDDNEASSFGVADALNNLPAEVDDVLVHINSYGGEVAEGLAIYNALRSCGKHIETVVDGFACSIASVVFMAGDERVMPESSALMVHNPWTVVSGNADELRKQADDLDQIAELSYRAYMRSGLSRDDVKSLMDGETWILPNEAVELGLATKVSEEPDGLAQHARMRVRQSVSSKATIEQADLLSKISKTVDEIKALVSVKQADEVEEAPADAAQPMQSPYARVAELLKNINVN